MNGRISLKANHLLLAINLRKLLRRRGEVFCLCSAKYDFSNAVVLRQFMLFLEVAAETAEDYFTLFITHVGMAGEVMQGNTAGR